MLKICFALSLLLAQTREFQVLGEIVSPAKRLFRRVSIESIDRRFVEYGEIGLDGKFVFKKVPEGLYKVTVTGVGGRAEQRTVEVRSDFADRRGRVAVRIELSGSAPPGDRLRVGAAALAVSPKAREEYRRASAARGDIEKAREHLKKAIEISPDFDEALNDLGTLYYRDGQFDKARELFERALKANPNSYAAQVNLGGALISLRDDERALTENLKAISMRPDDSLAQSQTGQALFRLERYDEALTHLELAKRLDPMSFTLPGLIIAQIHQIRGDKAGALSEYREFLKVHPGSPYTAWVRKQIALLEK